MDLINSYSVVAYIGGPLAEFIDRLRREVTPGCPHRAHITILPPRPLYVDTREAIEQCRDIVSRLEPFSVRLGDVDLFESTQVIKVRVEEGLAELRTLHDILNTGPFEYVENYGDVPHVTVAQEIASERVPECLEMIQRCWRDFYHDTPINIESLTLVQQRADGSWHDLAELGLCRLQPVRS